MIKHRGNSNYCLLRGELLGASQKAERDGRRLWEVRLRLAPPGRWRDLAREEPPPVAVLAWSDTLPAVEALAQLPPQTTVTVVGHLVADRRGLEVLADAITVDVGVALDALTAASQAD